jgi:hypothetical protein
MSVNWPWMQRPELGAGGLGTEVLIGQVLMVLGTQLQLPAVSIIELS